jgi:hypothetical protein
MELGLAQTRQEKAEHAYLDIHHKFVAALDKLEYQSKHFPQIINELQRKISVLQLCLVSSPFVHPSPKPAHKGLSDNPQPSDTQEVPQAESIDGETAVV